MEEEMQEIKKCDPILTLKAKVTKEIDKLNQEEMDQNSLECLYKLIDIAKDVENIEYWDIKKEVYKNEIRRI